MLSEFDHLVAQRKALQGWWELRTTGTYEGGNHVLRVDVLKPSLVTYCGQRSPGAKNYHDAPEFFIEAVRKELQASAKELTKRAYENELARLNTEIEKHRNAILQELELNK